MPRHQEFINDFTMRELVIARDNRKALFQHDTNLVAFVTRLGNVLADRLEATDKHDAYQAISYYIRSVRPNANELIHLGVLALISNYGVTEVDHQTGYIRAISNRYGTYQCVLSDALLATPFSKLERQIFNWVCRLDNERKSNPDHHLVA